MAKIELRHIIEVENNCLVIFRITNNVGAYVELMNYGATITSIVVPDKFGKMDNVVLGYNDYISYLSDPYYIGATIGRVANRISKAQFTLDGKVYELDKNDGSNSNHGGFESINKAFFDYSYDDKSITFCTKSENNSGGFPGNLRISINYSLSNDCELKIRYKVHSDQRTPINFTNHSYFNLGGSSKALNDQLKVSAEQYLEADDEFLPTGKILSLKDTPFDFTKFRCVKEMACQKDEKLFGYNTYFIRQESNNPDEPLAFLYNADSGRILEMYTSMPGFLFYTGDYLDSPFYQFNGICLEAQHYPDFLNQAHFPSNIIDREEEKEDFIIFKFLNKG